MTEWEQVGRLLRRLDAGDPRHCEHVALADGSRRDLRGGVGLHVHPTSGHGAPVRGVLGGDVDHAGASERVEMREFRGRHGGKSTFRQRGNRLPLWWRQPPIWLIERLGRTKST